MKRVTKTYPAKVAAISIHRTRLKCNNAFNTEKNNFVLCRDTSTSSQVSNCDVVVLDIYLDYKVQ